MGKISGFKIMRRLIKELKPLAPVMLITIIMGVLGYLAATSIATFSAVALGDLIDKSKICSFNVAIKIIIFSAILRGVFRYLEQLSGHYIAFKILAILRDKVFKALRNLAPAKLEIKEKGNLISIITSDIELLEVFYAHTIAPIVIAIITCSIVSTVLFHIHGYFGVLSIIFYLIIGFVIPCFSSKLGRNAGIEYRTAFGQTNSYLLDSLRGLKEILLFGNGEKRLNTINKNSTLLNEKLKKMKNHEGIVTAITDLIIMISILTYALIGYNLYIKNQISFISIILAIVILSSSFGPVVALSNLSNNLLHTFACAERVFSILDEEPMVQEVVGNSVINDTSIVSNKISFAYPSRDEDILKDVSLSIKKGDKIAIVGESGIGKSTFAKLIMRFWDVNKGEILLDNNIIKEIPTKSLRESEALVSQETFLFNESIEYNIKIGNIFATKEQVKEAAKKASIDKFIENLPNSYDTKVGELGGNLSSGEKQRIGLARAFLNDAPILILDEPTSNLDTLNEAEILKSIKENCYDKSIILISHRKSTTSICDKIFELKEKNFSMV